MNSEKEAAPQQPPPAPPSLKILAIIIDRDSVDALEDALREKHIHLHYMMNAMGTASSELLKSLGLSGTEKTVCICILPGFAAQPLMSSVADRMKLTSPGNGITFILPISGISSAFSRMVAQASEPLKERLEYLMDMPEKKDEPGYSLVVSLINKGYSDILMDAARAVGARGGTVIHARRSGIGDAVKFFGVSLQEEKEMVVILIPREQKKELMSAITEKCGMSSEAHGLVISLPVESCSGIGSGSDLEPPKHQHDEKS